MFCQKFGQLTNFFENWEVSRTLYDQNPTLCTALLRFHLNVHCLVIDSLIILVNRTKDFTSVLTSW